MKNSTIQMIIGCFWIGCAIYHGFIDKDAVQMMLCLIMSSGSTIIKMLYEQKGD
jgi:hypothetical protein